MQMGYAQVNWMSAQEIETAYAEEKRPILIFIYADWCKICKLQEATTFQEDSIGLLLNEEYYALKINGESGEAISFMGRNYEGGNSNQFHELAMYFGQVEG